MEKVYLYLIRRNKSDAKIIGTLFCNRSIPASRVTGLEHITVLDLPTQERADLERVIHAHRIEWEPWIESAVDYHSLMKSLHRAGISAPPSPNAPLVNFSIREIPRIAEIKLNKNKTMIRRMN